ncbi:hypothetical protein BKA80DRAFT_344355 [Phyllosticta citrichinensis]
MPPTHRIRIPSTARLLFNGTREQRTSTFHISTIIGAFATKSFSASAACSSNECSLLTTASGRQPPPPSILTVYDPAIFKLLLRFLYHEEYPKGLDDSDPVVHAQLYAAAHFYRVDVLETLALFFFSAAATPETNRGLKDLVVNVAVPEIDSLVKSHYFGMAVRGTDFVDVETKEGLKVLVEAIDIIYSTTPDPVRTLRVIAVEFCAPRLKALSRSKVFMGALYGCGLGDNVAVFEGRKYDPSEDPSSSWTSSLGF